jgi:hypothetical protein
MPSRLDPSLHASIDALTQQRPDPGSHHVLDHQGCSGHPDSKPRLSVTGGAAVLDKPLPLWSDDSACLRMHHWALHHLFANPRSAFTIIVRFP